LQITCEISYLPSNISFQVIKKYGEGNILSIFLGKYRRPRLENRLFLFLDLNSSTTLAEKLGHLRFSSLIQEIFNEVNKVAEKYHAQIYNYVGDEVILTWPESEGVKNENCVRMVFDFLQRIELRSGYFQKEFGVMPQFKVGLNGGEVTVAEVGIIKRDISYFGDVVNTAARLQGLCKDYQKDFLTSGYVRQLLKDSPGFTFRSLGELELKGKKELTNVFSIEMATG